MNTRVSSDDQLNARFREQLRSLCEQPLDGRTLESSVSFFEDLYTPRSDSNPTEGFRHSYSTILMIMYDGKSPADSEEFEQCIQRAEMLSANLDQISDALIASDCHRRVRDCFNKLVDHVSLESQRMAVSQFGHARIGKVQESFENTLSEQESRVKEMQKTYEGVTDDLDRVRSQHIAILGIFAAVVLVFNGSIGFSASAIEAMGYSPSLSNITFIVAIVGLVLVNTVALLLGFVWRMARDDAKMPCFAWAALLGADAVLVVLLVMMIGGCTLLPDTLLFQPQPA